MKTDNILKKTYFILLMILFSFIQSNCGYHLSGAGNYLPKNLKTIAIPDFENKSTSPDAQVYISFAIRDEFIKRSKLILTDDISSADLVLEGKIKQFLVTPLTYTERMSANQYRVTLVLNVKLIDRINNKIILKRKGIRFSDTYDIDTSDFFSQEGETLSKIADDIASSIVTGILENF